MKNTGEIVQNTSYIDFLIPCDADDDYIKLNFS